MGIDDQVGTSGVWTLPVTDAETITVRGLFLGVATSRMPRHREAAHPNGPGSPPAPRFREDGTRSPGCSACRWIEFRLFREETDGVPVDARPYLLHFTGGSSVPGEQPRHRFEEMLAAKEVIEVLTTRRNGLAWLSVPAGRVLALAASFDKGPLSEAYDSRVVA